MGAPVYGKADYLELGDWNAVCSMCGRKRKTRMLNRNWQGLYRCPEHDEIRQPQDFARGIQEHMEVPWAQLPNAVYVYTCSLNTQSAIPGYSVPGCMVPGNNVFDPNGV